MHVSDKLVTARLPCTIWLIFIFCYWFTRLQAWVGEYWSYCTRNCAITNADLGYISAWRIMYIVTWLTKLLGSQFINNQKIVKSSGMLLLFIHLRLHKTMRSWSGFLKVLTPTVRRTGNSNITKISRVILKFQNLYKNCANVVITLNYIHSRIYIFPSCFSWCFLNHGWKVLACSYFKWFFQTLSLLFCIYI